MRSAFRIKRPKLAQRIGPMFVYLYPRAGRLAALYVWASGRAKVPEYYELDTPEHAARVVAAALSEARKREAVIRCRRDHRRAADRDRVERMREYCKPGALLYTSWGYEQTNIEFFEVVARPSRDHVLLREIAAETENEGWCRDKKAPKPGAFIGPPLRRRIQGGHITIDKVRYAWPTEAGRAYHSTSYH